jgi:MoxR-like ATPase
LEIICLRGPDMEYTPPVLMHAPSILQPLGIHGWESVETPLFACILLGEPVCLVSEPGAGKTYFGEVLARALGDGVRYGYYDTSKSNFEDFIGFPNPESFKQGRAEFIENELTIWDKQVIMLDEVSRAARDTSNKWLEILGSRMLMGRPLPLVAVLGAMNPVTHHGTHLLDQAFADRFVAFLPLPAYSQMSPEARRSILDGATGLDAPALDFWQTGEIERKSYVIDSESFQQASQNIRHLLSRGAKRYQELLAQDSGKDIRTYADGLGLQLARADYPIEARRLKMLSRLLLAAEAWVSTVKGTQDQSFDRAQLAREMLPFAFPHPYTGQDLPSATLRAAHIAASSALMGNQRESELLAHQSHAKRMLALLSDEWSPHLRDRIVYDLYEDKSDEASMVAACLSSLSCTPKAKDALPASLWDRILQRALAPLPVEDFHIQIAKVDADGFNRIRQAAREPANERARFLWGYAAGSEDAGTKLEELEIILEDTLQTLRPLADSWKGA